jgi:UTP--glucose-1-phosphate uridylyltransferase
MKAVIPAGGLGTRFLPVTKAQPKEMLPVVDKPAIQYVVEEAEASGITDVLVITGRGKRSIEDHFDRSVELESFLSQNGGREYLPEIQRIHQLADIHYIRQRECKGLGHAIYCARKHVGQEPFVVLLGDTITLEEPPCTKQLIELFERVRAPVIAVERVPLEKVESYGVIQGKQLGDGTYVVENLVEKPSRDEAPSNLAVFGRYVLTPEIFKCLERTPPGRNNEIQLTDALNLLLKTQPIFAYEITGRRYDIGNKLDWLKATLELALEREELSEDLYLHMQQLVNTRFGQDPISDISNIELEGYNQPPNPSNPPQKEQQINQ